MNKKMNLYKKSSNIFALALIAVAGAAVHGISFVFWGEPTPPKSLLK